MPLAAPPQTRLPCFVEITGGRSADWSSVPRTSQDEVAPHFPVWRSRHVQSVPRKLSLESDSSSGIDAHGWCVLCAAAHTIAHLFSGAVCWRAG